MTDEPDDYEIPLEGYEAALGNDLSTLQARIEELEAQIEELHYGVTAAHFQGYIQGGQVAEAKLAKAVEALQVFADDANWFDTPDNDGVTMNPTWRGPTFTPEQFARDVIAELTGGQKDD
jgi:hypothetical protein